MKYKSKVGLLWCSALVLIIGISIWFLIDFLINKDQYYGLLLFVACDALFLWITFDTYYVLTEEYLEIRCACFTHIKIYYENIKRYEDHLSVLASCALSSDRVYIDYYSKENGADEICISPVHKKEFMEFLQQKCNS